MSIIIRDPFMQRVNHLPEFLVSLIGDFLPEEVVFEIKVRDLESLVKIKKLLRSCSYCLKQTFLFHFSSKREFLSLLSREDAINEVTPGAHRFVHGATGKIAEQKILQIMNVARTSNPKFAYEILNKLRILIDPRKNYRCNILLGGSSYRNLLTMEDVFAVHTY